MSEAKLLFSAYKGNTWSEKLTVFQTDNGEFEFLYQKFKRTNPGQAERKLNIKPVRNLIEETIYPFPTLTNVDFSGMPFFHLMSRFKTDETFGGVFPSKS